MNSSRLTSCRHLQNNGSNCIEDMAALLDHISEFSQLMQSHDTATSKQLAEEMSLFTTYIKWRIEDFVEGSYIYIPPSQKHNS